MHLVFGQHGRQAFGLRGAQGVNGAIQVLVQHFTVEKQERTEGLVLGRSGHVLLHSQVGEKGFDFGAAHFVGMALVMEQDEAGDPPDVGLFGADGVVLETDGVTDTSTELSAGLIEEFLGALFHISPRSA